MSLHRTRCCSGAQRSSPSRAPASHKRSRCGMKRCKTKCSAPFLQQCKKCNALFCLPHRLPEVHACGLN
jgi:predicted nucleic acid binding AN1-type Zn finger protein